MRHGTGEVGYSESESFLCLVETKKSCHKVRRIFLANKTSSSQLLFQSTRKVAPLHSFKTEFRNDGNRCIKSEHPLFVIGANILVSAVTKKERNLPFPLFFPIILGNQSENRFTGSAADFFSNNSGHILEDNIGSIAVDFFNHQVRHVQQHSFNAHVI